MSNVETSAPLPGHGGLRQLYQAWLTIDENPQAIRFVATRGGSLALAAVFIAVLALGLQLSTAALALVSATVLGMVLLPAHGLTILMASSLFYFAMRPFRIEAWTELVREKAALMPFGGALALQLLAVGSFLVLSWLFLTLQRRRPELMTSRRPVLALILLWFSLLGTAMLLPADMMVSAWLWSLVGVSVSSLWILGYSASDARGKDTTPTHQRALFLRPFWGGTAAPIGKSFGFLSRFAAKDADDLAVTRLKALKLAVWALVLTLVLKTAELIAFDWLGLQPLQGAILAHAAGASFGAAINWSSLLANFVLDLLIISVWGHTIVAIVRMAGYRIPRNTVNPLASRSIAEFWNRYFYYFKELLVDFFFYPAFTRFFKKNVKLRIAFATLCAAGLGNFLYHFMRETYIFASGDLLQNLAIFQSAAFYSLALAAGLIVSQLRARKVTPEDGFLAYQVMPRINVIAFFCFLKIFDDISGEGSLAERAAFALSLFGV